jgi:hypothetical protein
MSEAKKWTLAAEADAARCEARFQEGGPRVYVLETDRRLVPSGMSAIATLRCAFPGQTVFSRRKVDRAYKWHAAVAAATSVVSTGWDSQCCFRVGG